MKLCHLSVLLITIFIVISFSPAQDGLIPAFPLKSSDITLQRLARPGTPFDKVGRKFALLGDESGIFEAWAYPLKLLRNFEFSFFVREYTRPIYGRDIVRTISVSPAATVLTYTYQSFTVKAIYITPVEEPSAMILLSVDSDHPLTIVCGFLPVLQPMWPAGLGGQYAYWHNRLKAYVISESTGHNHGLVGSPAAEGISYTPAHMLSDTPNEFKIVVRDPRAVRDKYIPIYLAGGKGEWKAVEAVYQRLQENPEELYHRTVEHYRKLRENTLRVHTPDTLLNLAFEWAKISYDNLLVENPDLGRGLVAGLGASGTGGRPGFGWFFGGDAYINSFSLNALGAYQTVRDALAFTQKWQRKDGKMAHELSQAAGYIDWWNDYHYGYIHGDTTPFYLVAMYDYYRSTGDLEFVKQSWESLRKAYRWCLSTDANGDGLMDNRQAGLGASEYGDFTGVETDVYLGAVWTRANLGMGVLAEAVGDGKLARQARKNYQRAREAFRTKFWNPRQGVYAYAFNSSGQQVEEISPWCTVGLMWQLGEAEPTRQTLERLSRADVFTDWGVRMISTESKYFQPLNYNYGAVWPFVGSWAATAFFKNGFPLQGSQLLSANVQHTFDNSLGNVTEVFSGARDIWPQEAVSHQGFSTAGVVLPFVRGMLGLEGDVSKRQLVFQPQFPADWPQVRVENCRVGSLVADLTYTRQDSLIRLEIQARQAEGYRLVFAPGLFTGSTVQSVLVNGNRAEFHLKHRGYLIFPEVSFPLQEGENRVEIRFHPTVEVLPPLQKNEVGQRNRGLKIVSLQREADRLTLQVQGLAGASYELRLTHPEQITRVQGARLKGERLVIEFPAGEKGSFLETNIKIWVNPK